MFNTFFQLMEIYPFIDDIINEAFVKLRSNSSDNPFFIFNLATSKTIPQLNFGFFPKQA